MRRILYAGVLLGAWWLGPSPLAAARAKVENGAAARAESFLAPGAVRAAFEANLAVSSGKSRAVASRAAESKPAIFSKQARPQPVKVAAVLGQELSGIFQANLANPIQRALTPPSLSVTPEALSLPAVLGAAPTSHQLQIASLGGTVNWNASVSLLQGEGWLTVSPATGTATGSQRSILTANVNYGALGTAGIYQALINIRDAATGYAAPVPVALVLSSQQSQIVLSQSSVLFTVPGGGAAPPAQTLRISNGGTGTLNWSMDGSTLPSWLTVSPLSGAAGSDPAQASSVTFTVNNTAAQALSSGVYQALLAVSAAGAGNSPQWLTATLQRVPRDTPASPGISPNGLLFVAVQGGTAPANQSITIANRGGGTLTGQFNAATATGGNWLTINPNGGTTASGPFMIQASVSLTGLTAGIFRGTIRGTFSSGGPEDVDVVLVVAPTGTVLQRLRDGPPTAANGCTPQNMELIANSIGNGVSVPTSFPKVLVVSLVDSCGNLVKDATVFGNADGANIPLQSLRNGNYNGTWVPQREGTIALVFTALHPNYPTVTRTVSVSTAVAAEGIRLPVLFTDGVVEAAGSTPRRPLAPGGFISLFGSQFAQQDALASRIPLERELGGVRVRIGGVDAPVHFVGPSQINAQMPFEFQPGAAVSIVVNTGGRFTTPQNYLVAAAQPGIFVSSLGAAVLDAQFRLITPASPARIGDVIQIFATGLGATNPPVESGAAGPPSSTVTIPVTVDIGGIVAPVVYQGLAPGFVALYQVNVIVPSGVQPGDAVPLIIRQNGIASNPNQPATIPVR